MSKYINADDFSSYIRKKTTSSGAEWIVNRINEMPSADVREITRGTWSEEYLPDEDPLFRRRWVCSACGDFNTYGKPPYCPYCGADMRERKETE